MLLGTFTHYLLWKAAPNLQLDIMIEVAEPCGSPRKRWMRGQCIECLQREGASVDVVT